MDHQKLYSVAFHNTYVNVHLFDFFTQIHQQAKQQPVCSKDMYTIFNNRWEWNRIQLHRGPGNHRITE